MTMAVRSGRGATCRLSVGVAGRRASFPPLATDARGRARIRWQVPRNGPSGTWRFAASCEKARRRGARRARRHVTIGRGRGSGALVAHSSTEVLQGTFLANAGGGAGRSCGHVVGGGTVCFNDNALFAAAGQSTWYAMGRRPDLKGVVHADARAWLAEARGKATEGTTPAVGAVAVWLAGRGGADRLHGHVAYVSAVADGGRTVIVDEANWVPGMVSMGRRVRATEIAGYIYRPAASDAGSTSGIPGASGAPNAAAADTDGDGVSDALDACPLQGGSTSNAGCPTGSRFIFGDVDGDNNDDVVVITAKRSGRPSGANYTVLRSTGSGLTSAGVWGTADDVDVPSSRFVGGDFDNDGKEDVLAVTPRHDGHPSGATYSVLASTGSKFSAAKQWSFSEDVDIASSRFLSSDTTNDARDDLIVVSPRRATSPTGADYTVLASTGSAFDNTGLWGSVDDVDIAASRFLSGDLNNDARDDVAIVTPRRATHPSGATYTTLTSSGSKFNSPAVWGVADAVDVAGSRFAVADFNNDGSEDLLAVTARRDTHPSGANYNVAISTGSAFGSPGVWSFADDVDVVASRFVTPDLTGEGRSDVVAVTPRRAGTPSGASYTALTSSGSALANGGTWGFSDDVDIGALAD
jgi:surface antigen